MYNPFIFDRKKHAPAPLQQIHFGNRKGLRTGQTGRDWPRLAAACPVPKIYDKELVGTSRSSHKKSPRRCAGTTATCGPVGVVPWCCCGPPPVVGVACPRNRLLAYVVAWPVEPWRCCPGTHRANCCNAGMRPADCPRLTRRLARGV